jgi:hypothetical protein
VNQPPERVVIRDAGTGTIDVGCSVCGAREDVPSDPTDAMLAAIQSFMERHASCDVIDLTDR